MHSLSLIFGIVHSIRRDNVFADVMCMYKDSLPRLLEEYPFRVKFTREKGVDAGGEGTSTVVPSRQCARHGKVTRTGSIPVTMYACEIMAPIVTSVERSISGCTMGQT